MLDDVMVWEVSWMTPTPPHEEAGGMGQSDRTLMQAIEDGGFDAAIIFTTATQSALPAALLCRIAGIPVRLAHCRENPYALLSHWVRDPDVPEPGMRHKVQRQLDLLQALASLRLPQESWSLPWGG